MRKLTFIERNDALVRLKAQEHFEKDVALFNKVAPNSPVHNDLAKLNEFNKSTVHSKIILALLDNVEVDEIEGNRKPAATDTGTGADSAPAGDAPDPAATDTGTGADSAPAGDAPDPAATAAKKKGRQSKKNSPK